MRRRGKSKDKLRFNLVDAQADRQKGHSKRKIGDCFHGSHGDGGVSPNTL